MIWRNPGSAEGVYWLDSELMWESHDKEDKNGGFKAFLEKRSPIMKGNLKDGMPRNMPWWEDIDTRPKSGDRDETDCEQGGFVTEGTTQFNILSCHRFEEFPRSFWCHLS
jgi:hypothetical protein